MPFKKTPQKFNAAIKPVEIGTGDKMIVLGGENVYPFYSFDAPIENPPRVGIEILDTGVEGLTGQLAEFYAGAADMAALAQKAASAEGASFVSLRFEGADPNGLDRPVEECAVIAEQVANAIDLPLVIQGCKNSEKDTVLFSAIAEKLEGKNALFLSAKEENYKTVGASVGLAYAQKVGAESAVDINLAKQLNVLMTQMGVSPSAVVMNLGTATAGYGFEYVVSTMERVKAAALGQNDAMIQMPVITPVASETWNVKESLVSEEDLPEWGPLEERAVSMEITTAAGVLAAGSNAVILRHPQSVATISKLISELV